MSTLTLSAREISASEWPAVSRGFRDLTFEQSRTYADAAAARIGARAAYVVLTDAADAPHAAACLRIKAVPGLGRGIAWIAAGPLTERRDAPPPDPGALQAILVALRDHAARAGHILRLRFPATTANDPEALAAAAARAGFAPTDRAAAYRTVVVDLTQDQEALMAGLHGKWRNPLRNALKAGMTLEHGPFARMWPRFRALYQQVQQAKGFQPNIPPEFYLDLDGPDFEHEVLIARKDDEDIAGMTLGRAGTAQVYLFGATATAGRRLNAGHFLMWHAMLRGRETGQHCFDLGGIDAEENPTVTRFKQRTGGREVAAAGPFEARGPGPLPALIGLAEKMHARLKGKP